MQQRSIDAQIVDHILAFGHAVRSHGADRYLMTKASREKLRQHIGNRRYAACKRKLSAYVILSDSGTVITVGYRNHRMWRP